MQCKDIPTKPILQFLHDLNGTWANWNPEGWAGFDRSVRNVMPPDTPDKLVLAKMANMIAKDLVDGCPCGCRGDFVITDKGEQRLAAMA